MLVGIAIMLRYLVMQQFLIMFPNLRSRALDKLVTMIMITNSPGGPLGQHLFLAHVVP